MRRTLSRLINIYPGEGSAIAMLFTLGILWSLSVSLGYKYADALFIINVGSEHLPLLYDITSVVMIFLASLMLWIYHNFDVHRIFFSVIATGFVTYGALLAALLYLSPAIPPAFWYVLRLGGFIVFALFTTAFWAFIDLYYSLQDAKRLFPIFSSSIFTGVATTGFIMHFNLLTLEQVFFIIGILLSCTALLVWKLHHSLIAVHDEHSLQESSSQGEMSIASVVRALLSSRFSLLFMGYCFVLYLTMTITEYSYLSSFEAYFPADASQLAHEGEGAALTSFIGRCLVGVSVLNLFMGLFIYSRIIRFAGLSGALLLTPTILVFTFANWIFYDALFLAVMGFYIVEGSNYVIDDSNFNLLLNAVPPRLKYRVRLIIETFFEPIGMMLGSFLLSLGVPDHKTLGLLFGFAVFCLVLLLGRQFGRSIYNNLMDNAIHFHRSVAQWLAMPSVKERREERHKMLRIISSGGDSEALLALRLLLQEEDTEAVVEGLGLMQKRSSNTLKKSVALVSDSEYLYEPRVINKIAAWEDDAHDADLLAAIYFFLARHGLWHPEKAVVYLTDDNVILRGAALLALRKSAAHLPPQQITQLRALALQQEQELLTSPDEEDVIMILEILAIDGQTTDIDLIAPFLRDSRQTVSTKAMLAFDKLCDSRQYRYLRLLCSLLVKDRPGTFRRHCISAIVKLAGTASVTELVSLSHSLRPPERRHCERLLVSLGRRIVPTVLSLVKSMDLPEAARILSVRVLQELAPPQVRANLYEIILHEHERAYFFLWHSQTIQQRYPALDLELLCQTMATCHRQIIEFIIHFLGEAGELEDSELLARFLTSGNPKMRSQVIEALERSTSPALFRKLVPLLSDQPFEEKMRHCSYSWREMPLEELLDKMSQEPSYLAKMVAAVYKQQLDLPHWRKELREQMLRNEEIFYHFAYELLEA